MLSVQAITLANSALYGASGDLGSTNPSISDDGQIVAFQSAAANITPGGVQLPLGDAGNLSQVVVNNGAGSNQLITTGSPAPTFSGELNAPILSGNGQFVVYLSDASNLIPGQTITGTHLYETNLQSGATALVDINTSGQPSVQSVGVELTGVSVSDNGQYITFVSYATDLVSSPTVTSGENVYVRNMVAGVTSLVSVDVAGTDGGNNESIDPSISSDGSEIAFQSDASNLVALATTGLGDVYVRNLNTGTTSLVSANLSNAEGGDLASTDPVISGNGQYVTFLSNAADLQPITTVDHVTNVYVRDLATNTTTLVSLDAAADAGGNGSSFSPVISADGNEIAFLSVAPQLTSLDPMGFEQAYVYDQTTGTLTMVSTNAAGTAGGDGNATSVALSADGSVVAFTSVAGDITNLPTEGVQQVYAQDLATSGATMMVSVDTAGTAGGNGDSGSSSNTGPQFTGPLAVSADGATIAFESAASDLVADDNNQQPDVFSYNLTTGTTTLLSARDPSQPLAYTATGASFLGGISADGTQIAVNGGGGDLIGTQATAGAGTQTAAVSNTQTGTFFAPDPGSGTNADSGSTVISSDGSEIAFDDSLISGQQNVYAAANPGGAPVLVSANSMGNGPGNNQSFSPIISGFGSTVVFSSLATNLVSNFVAGGPGDVLNLYARNLNTGSTSLVSIDAAGTAAGNGLTGDFGSGDQESGDVIDGGQYSYSVSASGQFVAFESTANDLTSINTGSNPDIYVRDLVNQKTQLIDVAMNGTSPANGPSSDPVISANGQYVAFLSTATNLVPATAGFGPGGAPYVYVRDLLTQTTTLVGLDPNGSIVSAIGTISISADGQVIAYTASDFGATGQGTIEAFAYNMATGTAQGVSVNAAGQYADFSPGDSAPLSDPIVSADGNAVGFESSADNLVPGTFDGSLNLYVRNLQTGTTTLVTANLDGTGGGTSPSTPPTGVNAFALSADGSTVAFSSDQDNLVQGEYDLISNVFVVQLGSTTPTTGSISGAVFDDANGSGQLQTGDAGLAGWTVYIDTGNVGSYVTGDPTAVTDANGDYTFTNLAPGTYTVGEIVMPGYQQTAPPPPGTASVTVVAGQTAAGPSFGDEPLPPDLTVQSITVPASAQPGQPASPLSYTVVNNGAAASGDWQDAVYLSTETTIDATATLVAVLPQTGGLAPGASYTQSLLGIPLPVLPAGNEYLLVQVDRRGQVPEPAANKAAEFAASTTPIAFKIPTLTVDTSASGSFTAAGEDQVYELTVAAGQNLVLTLSSQASAGALSLSAQFGALPAAGQAGTLTASSFSPNEQLVIAPTQAGTYFIDVHSQAGAAATAGFMLTATTPGLALLGSSPGAVGNGGNATIEIDGTGFTPATTFALVGSGGPIAAQSSQFVSGSQVFATFDLTGQPTGSYTIQATGQGGPTVSLPAAVIVQPGVAASIVTSLSVPAQTRIGRIYSFVVTYTNPSNDDAPAPLLQIQSPNETDIGLAPDALGMENYTIQVLGISPNGPAGILGPGQQGTVTVYFQSVAGDNQFTVGVNTTADTTAVDYSTLSMELNPGLLPDDQWNAIFANFQQEVGPTAGDYVAMLDQNATLLPPALGNNALATDVAELQIDRAQAAIGPSITGTLQTTDPQLALGNLTVVATNETTGDVFATTSLNDGSFIFDSVTPGTYEFSVEGALISGTPTATVAAGQAVQGVTIPVSLAGAIAGQVVASESGAGIAGATVTAVGSDGTPYQTTTGSGGVYELSGLPADTYTILAEADGRAQEEVTGVAVNGAEEAENFSLAVQSVISGTVTLAAGGPTGNDLVVVAQVPGNTDLNQVYGDVESGSGFSIANLPAGTYDLSISEDGYVPQAVSNVVVGAGGTASIGTVQLSIAASASGTVTSTDPNTPTADALVGAFMGTTLVEAVGTDTTGAFSFTDLPAGTYTFGVAGAAGTVTTPTVVLAPGQAATGIAVNVAPPPGAQAIPADATIQPSDTEPNLAAIMAGATAAVSRANGRKTLAMTQLATLPPPKCGDGVKKLYDQVVSELKYIIESYKQKISVEMDIIASARSIGQTAYRNRGLLNTLAVTLANQVDIENGGLDWIAVKLAKALMDVIAYKSINTIDCGCMNMRSSNPLDITADASSGMACMAPEPSPNQAKPAPQGQGSSQGRLPVDPNELTGPGVGAAGYVAAGQTLPYEVGFENQPTATAAAQEVTVTDTLASDLNWTTFQLGDITFGSNVIAVPAGLQSYSTTVDTTNTDGTALLVDVSAGLDLATGVVTWTFRSVDPTTGLLPAGVDDGFLPPEDGTGRGTASVAYTVQPLASLTDGASFMSAASVVFDTNAALATNTVTNTIDSVAPTSTVAALPATSPASFMVSWQGTDPDNGSGVAVYDVYVSTNGGPFVPFQTGTAAMSAPFTGVPGDTYAFYSVATDAVGNVQTNQGVAQATTEVIAPNPAISGAASATVGAPYVLSLSASGPGSGTITGWTITWGDGAVQPIAGNPASVTHVYSQPGTDTISASATTPAGTFAAAQNVVVTVVAATMPPPPLVTVQSVLPGIVHLKHKKTEKVLVVTFSGALEMAAAEKLADYLLVVPAKSKKPVHGKPPAGKKVALVSAVYSAAGSHYTVTLTPKAKLPTGPLQLTIVANGTLDAEGREIDGNRDGQPGGNFVATFKGAGIVL